MNRQYNPDISIFWFRRDLRLDDNCGLYHALKSDLPVLPLFIFDSNILDRLTDKTDKRVEFIHNQLTKMHKQLEDLGSTLLIEHGKPMEIWKKIINDWQIISVYTNHDYEPYACERDKDVHGLLRSHNIQFNTYKDQVIFEKNEIIKPDGKPYTVFTPYKNKWLGTLNEIHLTSYHSKRYFHNFFKTTPSKFTELKDIGFKRTGWSFPSKEIRKDILKNYHKTRDFPGIKGTTHLGVHLRFGTISIRKLAKIARSLNQTFLSELIWREFFMMILSHFPRVINNPFKPKYDKIQWINNEEHYRKWCKGRTGYPIVDAGMRELNETGYMHNRVRMITASFLVKHLLIDWQWGEKYFAEKLLDFELSSNNGNWQWAAGCGCDAVPYFRVFNPSTQIKKFDPDLHYIKKWIPQFKKQKYLPPIVEHSFARERALTVYKTAIKDTL